MKVLVKKKISPDLRKAGKKMVFGKSAISIRLDRVIIDFFRKSGRGWQTRINEVLKRFMEEGSGL